MKNLHSLIVCSGLVPLTISLAAQANDTTWSVSQTDFGGVGLLQVPSGRMADEGEFSLGVNVNRDYHHLSASIQLFSWLETTIRYTQVPDMYFSGDKNYSGDTLYTDKGIDFKLRLLNESYWLPETSIGVRDFGGTGLFDGEYLAATKRVGAFDFTLGLGWGYLGQSGNVNNPFCSADDYFCQRYDDVAGKGGSVDYKRWFTGPSALFGGIEYQTPYAPLRLKLEYDGNDYSQDFPVVRGSKSMTQHTPWNFGVSYRLGDWGDAKVSYQRGDTLTLGLNFATNFNQVSAIWRDEPKPALRPSSQTPDGDWPKATRELSNNAGYRQSRLTADAGTVTLTGEQKKYRDRSEAIERAALILDQHAGNDIETFRITETRDGLTLTQTDIDRASFVSAAGRHSIDEKIADSYQVTNPGPTPESVDASTEKRWNYGFEPVLKQSVGGPESFYLYSFGINGTSNVWLTDHIELGGSIYLNLFDNYDKFNYVENSPHVRNYATPRVRTMFRAYVHDNTVRMNHLQLTWFEQPADNLYSQVYAGYLEMMFAGVGGELLYRPLNQNWAIGIDANLVSQRDPNSWFGVYQDDYFFYDESSCSEPIPRCQAYVLSKGTTGHVTGYYMPQWDWLRDTLFKVSAGQFLGGDKGARVDFSKQFKSGVTVGAFATFTNLTAEEYGEGSFNKGFYVSIPMDIVTIKPSTSRATIAWQPITRDGGQMLSKRHNLFEKTDARFPWYQRPSTVETASSD
ncbi:YjbH domain-containing protein [Vibrio sp.]|uniref:YjbH domain-containing protein n=1 Tax=Vibrio sp. TaxID=678 RepID=UPI003D10A3CF